MCVCVLLYESANITAKSPVIDDAPGPPFSHTKTGVFGLFGAD